MLGRPFQHEPPEPGPRPTKPPPKPGDAVSIETVTWYCSVGSVEEFKVSKDVNNELRKAIAEAYIKVIGKPPNFLISGWKKDTISSSKKGDDNGG